MNHARAARARWQTPDEILRRDLKLLGWAIRLVRRRIIAREKIPMLLLANRRKSLIHFHRAGKFRRRQRSLEHWIRVVEPNRDARQAKERAALRSSLEKSYRRVLWRQNNAIEMKLAKRLRTRFEKAFHCRKTSRVCAELTGTSLAGLRAHLESLFQPGMTWANYGFWGWHIDHKKPVCSFNLQDSAEQRACFHYTNLQPLWKDQNFAKGRKTSCG